MGEQQQTMHFKIKCVMGHPELNVEGDGDDEFKLKMKDDGPDHFFKGYLICHDHYDFDRRDGGSHWAAVHKHEADGAVFKRHSRDDGWKLEKVGGPGPCGWLAVHRYCDADKRDDGSTYMMVHDHEFDGSVFEIEEDD